MHLQSKCALAHKIHERKLIYPWKQVHHTYPCIKLVPTKRNPNNDLSLLNPPPPNSPIPTNIINYLISKPLQNLPNLIMIKPTQYFSLILLFYHF